MGGMDWAIWRAIRRFWSFDRIAAALGFALTLAGLLGQRYYVEPAADRLGALMSDLARQRGQSKMLRAALALDDFTSQNRSAVFALRAGPTRTDAANEALIALQRQSLERRHDGARAFIAALGAARDIPYAQTQARYQALVEQERREGTLASFSAANDFEAQLSESAMKDVGAERISMTKLQYARVAARKEASARAWLLALSTSLASSLLFLGAFRTTGAPAPRPVADPHAAALAALVQARDALARAPQPTEARAS